LRKWRNKGGRIKGEIDKGGDGKSYEKWRVLFKRKRLRKEGEGF